MHAWSTDVPGLRIMQAASQQATGLASVTVHEAGIGKEAYTGRAREKRTGFEATDWSLEPSLVCKVGQALQGSRQAMVTAGNRSGIISHVVDRRAGLEHYTCL